ncbi:MAG: UDP-2,3-diacylglucosamine diphosphatase [Chitinophagaceae bacterium]|nr:UDP-2,3-diacylglucosamine diphosphatase [Chitinophagaceae bacterium]
MKVEYRAIDLALASGKKAYFASDFHFGIPDAESSLLREKRVVAWLDGIATDAAAVFLQGDLFDAWIEYRSVVPRGFVRFLGKLAELSDRGIKIVIFTGNHDLWMSGYLEQEIGAVVHHDIQAYTIGKQRFLLGHGDGVSVREQPYRLMKGLFRNPLSQWIYKGLHPNIGVGIANYFSRRGLKHKAGGEPLKPDAEEYQWEFVEDVLKNRAFDYIILGHRHIAQYRSLQSGAVFVNLGDWFKQDTHAVFDGEVLRLINY